LLSRKGLLDAAIKEVGYVRILLRLGDAQIAQAFASHDIRKNVRERIRLHDKRKLELLVVARHADVGQIFWRLARRDHFLERLGIGKITSLLLRDPTVACKNTRDLTGTICAEVEVNATVIVADRAQRLTAIIHADKWHDEFVGHVAVVRFLYSTNGIDVRPAFGFAADHGVVRFAFTLPAFI